MQWLTDGFKPTFRSFSFSLCSLFFWGVSTSSLKHLVHFLMDDFALSHLVFVSSHRAAGTAVGPPVPVWGWCHLIRLTPEVTFHLMTQQVWVFEVSWHNTICCDYVKEHIWNSSLEISEVIWPRANFHLEHLHLSKRKWRWIKQNKTYLWFSVWKNSCCTLLSFLRHKRLRQLHSHGLSHPGSPATGALIRLLFPILHTAALFLLERSCSQFAQTPTLLKQGFYRVKV